MKRILRRADDETPAEATPAVDDFDAFASESDLAIVPAWTAPTPLSAAHAPLGVTERRPLLPIMIGLAAIGIATGFWAYASNRTVAAATGSLRVESEPSAATVLIDGQTRGATPLTITLAPGDHKMLVRQGALTKELAVTIGSNTTTVHHIEWPAAGVAAAAVGKLSIVTVPPRASIVVDGVARGVTPLVVDALTVGEHQVVLRGPGIAHQSSVRIDAGTTASLVVNAPLGTSAFSGWMAPSAAVPMQIFEGGRLVGSTESDRIMLAAGAHSFEFVNDALGFRATRDVRISSGQTINVSVPLPQAPLSVNAIPWAQVWIDGQPQGETPIGNVMQPVGAHELVFRHPDFGERRLTAVVTLKEPARVSVDMRKP